MDQTLSKTLNHFIISILLGAIGLYYGIYSVSSTELDKTANQLREGTEELFEFSYELDGGSREVFRFRRKGDLSLIEAKYPYGFKAFGIKTIVRRV